MAKRTIAVMFTVEVETDDAKFTDAWLAEWRQSFYQLHSVDDHAAHIAQLEARGLLDAAFTEGYGPLADMGIKASVVDWQTEILS